MAEQQIVGNYRLLELLGGGTFGQVYRGVHRFLTTREVAIKLMRGTCLTDENEQRLFLNEATILERLHHPGILPILDAGISDGIPYLVTAYASNGSLRQRMRQYGSAAFPPIEALRILKQIANALQYAHNQHVIHRDLKPENILFTASGDILLADFGLATILNSLSIEPAKISGTPLYMAPEQFKGQVCKESDQYALGCLTYELLTGQRPFDSSDMYALSFLHMYESPLPPGQINPRLSAQLSRAIVTAMAKDRSARYPDIRTFSSRLQATREMWIEEGERLIRLGQMEEALLAWDEVIQHDPQNPLPYNIKAQTLHRLGRDQEALALYDYALRYDSHLAIVYSNRAESLFVLGCYEDALASCERALTLDGKLATAHSYRGRILCALERYGEALAACERAIALAPRLMLAYATKGEILQKLGRDEEALETCERTIQLDPENRRAREIYEELFTTCSTSRMLSLKSHL